MKILMILLLGFPLFLQAQMEIPVSYWDATLHIGPYISGISRNLEKEMQENSFTKGSFFGYGGGSGRMANNKPLLELALESVTAKAWSAKLLLSFMSGHITGFSSRYGDLKVEYSQVAASLLAGYYSRKRTARIAAGPALYFTSLQTAAPLSLKKINSKPGFVIEAGLRFPAKGKIFIDMNSQYQFVGKQDLGTYDFGPNGSMTVGKKSVNCFSFNFGLGVRFGKMSIAKINQIQ